jgi:hypothetical protein
MQAQIKIINNHSWHMPTCASQRESKQPHHAAALAALEAAAAPMMHCPWCQNNSKTWHDITLQCMLHSNRSGNPNQGPTGG